MTTYLTGEIHLDLHNDDRDGEHPYRSSTDQIIRLYVRGTSVADILDLLAHQVAVLQKQPALVASPASD